MNWVSKFLLYLALLVGGTVAILMSLGGREGRVTTTVEGILRCRPDEAMSWIAQPAARRRWVGGMKDYRDLGSAEYEVGQRTRVVMTKEGKETEVVLEIVQMVEDRVLVMRATQPRKRATVRYELEPKGPYTRLKYTLVTEYDGFFRKLVAPLNSFALRREMLEDLDRLQDSATFAFS